MMCLVWGLLLLGWCNNWAQEISSPTRFIEQPFDVLEYRAFLALDSLPVPVLGESACTMVARWRGAPDTLRFHLRGLEVLRCEYIEAGRTIPVSWQTRGTPTDATFHYAVPALPSHHQGDTVALRITFRGTMTGEPSVGGLSWGGVQREGAIVYALGVGFYNNYVSATQHWLPCYDHPSDKARFDLTFRVPRSYVVASGGQEYPVRDSAQWRLFRFRSDYPAATYLLTFAAIPESTVAILRDEASLPYPIVLYARRADSTATRRSFRLLPQMVTAFERRFGAYPFEKVGYVMTQKGAMEHQTMISYPTSLARSGDTVNLVAAHELAHQWFGDCVTPLDFRDAWFNESFATFAESLWREELGGTSAYLQEQQRKINAYLNQYAKPGNPLFEGILTMYDFDRRPPSSNYPHVIYEKGAAVLGMLRAAIGDSLFFRWCRMVLERYRYGNIALDTLEQLLSQLTGQHDFVTRFFSEWIRGKGWPVLAIDALSEPSAFGRIATLHIRQMQPDSLGIYTTLPLELSFIGADTVHRIVTITAREQTVVLDSLNTFGTIAVNIGPRVRSLVQLAQAPTVTEVRSEGAILPLQVFPNPTSETVMLSISSEIAGPVMLYDACGSCIRSVGGTGVHALSTQNLAAGTYYAVARDRAQRLHIAAFVVLR
jgi:aminopeptidase N